MSFGEAVSTCYSKYATFAGRASRSEYWFFQLYHFLVVIGCCFLLLAGGVGVALIFLAAIVNFLPSLSVLVRRLHDTGHSGWWYWIVLIPLVGVIVLLVFLCTRGTEGVNRFDTDHLSDGEIARTFGDGPRSQKEDIAEQLTKLAKLRDSGTITQEEFERLKTKLI